MTDVPLAKQVTALSKAFSHIQLFQSDGFSALYFYGEAYWKYTLVYIFSWTVLYLYLKPDSIVTNIMPFTYQLTLKYAQIAYYSVVTSC